MNKYFIKKTLVFTILILFFGTISNPGLSANSSYFNNIKAKQNKIINYYIKSSEKDTHIASAVDWWPMYRHDSGHSGCSSSIAPNTNQLVWKENINDEIYSATPIVHNERLYISTGGFDFDIFKQLGFIEKSLFEPLDFIEIIDSILTYKEEYYGGIYCLDADEGKALWNYPLYAPNDPLAVEEKIILTDLDTSSYTSSLYCLDAGNGNLIWEQNLDILVTTPTIGNDDILVIGGIDFYSYGGVLKCYKTDGSSFWSYYLPANEIIWSVPACYDKKVYFIASDFYSYFKSKLYCVDIENGEYIWSQPIYSLGSIACKDNRVILVDFDIYYGYGSNLKCFDGDTGNLLWQYSLGSIFCLGHPTVCDDSIYISGIDLYSYSSYVYRFSLDSGELIWKIKIPDDYSYLISSPVCSSDKMLLCSTDLYSYTSKIFAFGAGDTIWSYKLDYESSGLISIADEKVFISDYSGNIYAFEDVLKIGRISGGILCVKAEVKNTGVTDLYDIHWEINVTGGIFNSIDIHAEGTIPILRAGETIIVRAFPIIGFGNIDIDVMVSMPGSNPSKKSAYGLILGLLSIVKS